MPEVRIGVDVGGTFTDVVVFADDQIITAKVPSTVNQAHGVLAGIRRTHLEPTEVTLFSHGTTVGTNALLGPSGARTLEKLQTDGLESAVERLEVRALAELPQAESTRRADLRYRGQAYELTVAAAGESSLAERFRDAHLMRYGYVMDDEVIEVVAVRVMTTRAGVRPDLSEATPVGTSQPGRREIVLEQGPVEARVVNRAELGCGSKVEGPCIVSFEESTALVPTGLEGRRRRGGDSGGEALVSPLDAIDLSVLSDGLSGIAEEMGAGLIRSSYSSNIKERRDHSAALFDSSGRMVAQAEHIPVHLGAMPEAVAAVIERDPQVGDVFIVNDPHTGGTHLPDIRPGSMPSDSREIYQEGMVVPPVRLMRGREYPLRVERQQLAYGSGGTGRHAGGDGIERSVRVLEDCSLSLLCDGRRHGPPGRHGGEAGKPGRNLLNGEELPAKCDRELRADDVVTVVTPGGGGWGRPQKEPGS